MYPYHVIYPLFVADALARLDRGYSAATPGWGTLWKDGKGGRQ